MVLPCWILVAATAWYRALSTSSPTFRKQSCMAKVPPPKGKGEPPQPGQTVGNLEAPERVDHDGYDIEIKLSPAIEPIGHRTLAMA